MVEVASVVHRAATVAEMVEGPRAVAALADRVRWAAAARQAGGVAWAVATEVMASRVAAVAPTVGRAGREAAAAREVISAATKAVAARESVSQAWVAWVAALLAAVVARVEAGDLEAVARQCM